ncbi:fimbrial protein [Siccibacter turicensis]|uniref:fimbrial protein n=1 Tax=Siccibacter turicensis TaxID=357233 RepID=UPI000467D804|nr:fimbrial protein [Siccibacter turicensis]
MTYRARLSSLVGIILLIFFNAESLAVSDGDTSTVYITGTLVDAPQCIVNSNNVIDVDFGNDILTTQVNGINYKKELNYYLICTNPAQQGMKMTISGTPATFNSMLIKTSNAGLGILLYNGNNPITPGAAIAFNYTAPPVLYAVPVAQNNTSLSTGPFTSTATMIIAYQ